MMTEVYTIEGGQKDVSSLSVGDYIKQINSWLNCTVINKYALPWCNVKHVDLIHTIIVIINPAKKVLFFLFFLVQR